MFHRTPVLNIVICTIHSSGIWQNSLYKIKTVPGLGTKLGPKQTFLKVRKLWISCFVIFRYAPVFLSRRQENQCHKKSISFPDNLENNPSSLFSVLFFPLLFYGHPKIHSCLSTSLKTLVNFPFVVNCSLVPISVGGTAHPFFLQMQIAVMVTSCTCFVTLQSILKILKGRIKSHLSTLQCQKQGSAEKFYFICSLSYRRIRIYGC